MWVEEDTTDVYVYDLARDAFMRLRFSRDDMALNGRLMASTSRSKAAERARIICSCELPMDPATIDKSPQGKTTTI